MTKNQKRAFKKLLTSYMYRWYDTPMNPWKLGQLPFYHCPVDNCYITENK